MSEEFEVPGQHEHALEHAAHVDSLGRMVAMFTAVLATVGAIISYQNSGSESLGLELKNEAILKKSEASDQWAYYQAKGIKQVILEHTAGSTAAERARLPAAPASGAGIGAGAGRHRAGGADRADAPALAAADLGRERAGRRGVLDAGLALIRPALVSQPPAAA
jgi:hypothetical protein